MVQNEPVEIMPAISRLLACRRSSMARPRFEPGTPRFSGVGSTQRPAVGDIAKGLSLLGFGRANNDADSDRRARDTCGYPRIRVDLCPRAGFVGTNSSAPVRTKAETRQLKPPALVRQAPPPPSTKRRDRYRARCGSSEPRHGAHPESCDRCRPASQRRHRHG
jgi:hypothetical protein